MISLGRILFPADLSEQSRRIAPFVKAMAKRFHSEVTILHVLEIPATWYVSPEVAWDTYMSGEQLREEQRAKLDSFLVDEFEGVPVVRELAEGEPAVQIDCYARTKNASLIMMPTHGYGTFRRLLLGSVTAKVLHDVSCPVWTAVHTPELVSHDPQRCSLILCAVDTDAKDARVIRWAADFAARQSAQLHLVHAIPEAAIDKQTGLGVRDSLFHEARQKIDHLLDEAGLELEVTLYGGKPEHVVHDVALDERADLVVIGRGVDHALGRLRSNAYAMIRESPCPVISV